MGHLGAGLFEIQRTGDDTSGHVWERTRRMGVNTLAYRLPQHGTFFVIDADCAAHTSQTPWNSIGNFWISWHEAARRFLFQWIRAGFRPNKKRHSAPRCRLPSPARLQGAVSRWTGCTPRRRDPGVLARTRSPTAGRNQPARVRFEPDSGRTSSSFSPVGWRRAEGR